MKHILVIDGFIPVHFKMKELGAKLSIITETGRLKGKYPDLYYRAIQIPDEGKEFFAEKLNEYDKIDAIANFSDNRQKLTSEIAKKLNLDYLDGEAIEKICNKQLMREELRKYSIDGTIGRKVFSKKDIYKFIDEHSLPIVIKPVDGVASKGVSIVRTNEEVESALDWYQLSGLDQESLYVEQYIEGEEYSVESFSEDGEVHIISITKKIKTDDEHCIEIGQYVGDFLEEKTFKNIKKYIKKFINIIGINRGPAHTEIILKPNGDIGIIETHSRLGGDEIPTLVKQSYGIDMIELWAKQVLGEKVLKNIVRNINKHSIIYFFSAKHAGTLEEFPNIDKYTAKHKENIKFKFYKDKGDKVTKLIDSYSRLGHVILTGDNFEKILEEVKSIVNYIETNTRIDKLHKSKGE